MHALEVSLGSLFPPGPDDSPARRARILMDGTAVLDIEQDTYDSSPYDVAVGTNPIGGSTCGYAFTGAILSVKRGPP